jgi:hypothetical protein
MLQSNDMSAARRPSRVPAHRRHLGRRRTLKLKGDPVPSYWSWGSTVLANQFVRDGRESINSDSD